MNEIPVPLQPETPALDALIQKTVTQAERTAGHGPGDRIIFLGGVIMGFAARFARGCTSGQALSGGALLSVGSWVFMMAVFAGGYLMAPLVRRQWR